MLSLAKHRLLTASQGFATPQAIPRPRRRDVSCAALNPDDQKRIAEAAAMQEAIDLYAEAQRLAHRQMVQELRQLEFHEIAVDTSQATEPRPTHAHGPLARQHGGSSQPDSHFPAASFQQLESFWVEQGLKSTAAERLAKYMSTHPTRYCNLDLLAIQVQRLGRVIPGPVPEMVAKDPSLLEAKPAAIAQNFVHLVQLFPHKLDIVDLACKQPKLLYCDDLTAHVERTVAKLMELHPSHSKDVVLELMRDCPDLVFRMDYYMHVRSLDELPIDLQNLMIITGQGLHQLHQMYSDSISPRFL